MIQAMSKSANCAPRRTRGIARLFERVDPHDDAFPAKVTRHRRVVVTSKACGLRLDEVDADVTATDNESRVVGFVHAGRTARSAESGAAVFW